jgi:C-terminal processing protease CtpA/Prc
MVIFAVLTSCTTQETPEPTTVAPSQTNERQFAIFTELDQAIRGGFIYEDFGGVDWVAISNQFRTRIQEGMTDDEFYRALPELVSAFPDGMASFSTREERINSDLEQAELYEGIGAFVAYRAEPEPHIVILSVIENSPAEAAGLLAHDSVFAINGTAVTDSEGIGAVERIRGPRETAVTLEIASPGEARRDVDVLRQQVLASDVVLGGLFDTGIYYVLFPVSADESLMTAIDAILQTLADEDNAAGLILDLRISSSSPGWPLGELLVLFTDGELGTFFSRVERSPMEVTGQDILGSQTIPLAVLIGPDTSGAPEIFAASLTANGRATLIGMPTPGNTFGFSRTVLSDGSQLLYANSSFESITGFDLAKTGLSPVIMVDADWDEVTLSNDPVIAAAIDSLISGE